MTASVWRRGRRKQRQAERRRPGNARGWPRSPSFPSSPAIGNRAPAGDRTPATFPRRRKRRDRDRRRSSARGQHHSDLDGGIGTDPLRCVLERGHQREIERVELLRPIQTDARAPTADLHYHLGRHNHRPSRSAVGRPYRCGRLRHTTNAGRQRPQTPTRAMRDEQKDTTSVPSLPQRTRLGRVIWAGRALA